MGKAFMFQGKALCEDCFKRAVDYETLAGRQAPPKKMVEAASCADCKVKLEPEEEL